LGIAARGLRRWPAGSRGSAPDEARHRGDEELDLRIALSALDTLTDTVTDVSIQEADPIALRAAVVAFSWVRMSMQYLSSSIMRCRPRT